MTRIVHVFDHAPIAAQVLVATAYVALLAGVWLHGRRTGRP